MGAPTHKPTDELRNQVEVLAGYGLTNEQIADVVGMAESTLKKYYAEALRVGAAKATAKVAHNLFKMATGSGREAVTASIFWMKTRAGWKEKKDVDVSASGGKMTISWEE